MAFTGVTAATAGYLGMLFRLTERPNALLKIIGGLTGGMRKSTSIEFPVGTFYSVPAPSQPARLEGAVAPAANNTTISQTANVVQIFQEKVSLSYLAQSNHAVSGVVPIPQGEVNAPVTDPRSQEFQIMATLKKIAQDANYSMLRGTFAEPADPTTTALGTRGVLTAISTNILDVSGATAGAVTAAIYRGYVDSILAQMIQYNGYAISDTFYLFAGVTEYANIAAAFSQGGILYYRPDDRVFGVMVRGINTTFGVVNLVIEPDMPANQFALLKADAISPVGLEVPGKGILFEEPLYKQGSSDEVQLYGQMGVDHGPEYLHGLVKVVAGIAIAQ